MSNLFKYDFYRMTGTEYRWYKQFKLIGRHNLQFMYWYRKYQSKRSILCKLMLYRMSRKYGLEISADAQIGKGLYLGHPYNITVAEEVVLGKNVNLHKGCTIGRESRGSRSGVPTIGNNVFVGINSTIVGNIKVGSDVVIAPNAFVNFDVPDHSVVIGNPAQIHHKDDAAWCYVNFLVD